MGMDLNAPSLNIDGFYFHSSSRVFGYNWTLPGTQLFPYRNENTNRTYKVGEGDLVQRDYMALNGRCQPDNDLFQWGFSFLLLFVLVLLLVVWSLATYLIWLQSHFALRYLECEDEVAGEYTAAFRLVTALREEFKTVGQYPDHMSEAEIKHQLRYTLGGGCIEQASKKAGMPSVREMRIAHMDARLEEHKWWILAWFLNSAIGATITGMGGAAGLVFGFTASGVAFGIMMSGIMGWQVRSRYLFTLIWGFVGFVIGTVLVVLVYGRRYA